MTILDLCSGVGFLGMLLVELLPPERVHACVLMDLAWPMKGGTPEGQKGEKKRTQLNWDHVYDLPWPATLTTRRSDLKTASTHKQILGKILEPAPGPAFILGIHLCGMLSIRAVETFNTGPKCVGLALKPCCLPSPQYAKERVRWRLGAHSFDAKDVCMWGKYNKNQWQGPPKAMLESRFRTWANNLHRGMLADTKSCDKLPLVAGHYQDTYLFAEREFSSAAPPKPDEDAAALVRSILGARTSLDVLGVSEEASNRSVFRRFTELSKIVGQLIPEIPDAEDAFARLKVACDELRARSFLQA